MKPIFFRSLPFFALIVLAFPALGEQICRSQDRQPKAATFRAGKDGTVSDPRKGLQWQRCPYGLSGDRCEHGKIERFNAAQAQTLAIRINNTGFAGHRNWRLPSADELGHLVSNSCVSPAIDLKFFPNTPPVEFWTADSEGVQTRYVDFKDGYAGKDDGNLPNAVRLVRTVTPTGR